MRNADLVERCLDLLAVRGARKFENVLDKTRRLSALDGVLADILGELQIGLELLNQVLDSRRFGSCARKREAKQVPPPIRIVS